MNARVVKISSKNLLEQFKQKYSFKDNFNSKFNAIEITDVNTAAHKKIKSVFNEIGLTEVCSIKSKNGISSLILPLSFSNLQVYKEIFESTGLIDVFNSLYKSINNYLQYENINYSFRGTYLRFDKAYIMGILNVTPDSFSDGGKYFNMNDAINFAEQMIDAGADIIDVGGESTRPGSDRIKTEDELERVIPVIEVIRKEYPQIIISVDTTKSIVALKALEAGADIINDISGAAFDRQMLDIVSRFDAGLVLMHIKGKPKTMQNNPSYTDVVSEVYDYLTERISAANDYGINKIFVDPGIGFGKTINDNYKLINRLDEFKSLGHPILIGVSKKSFLGKSLNISVDERENATICAESISMNNGARIIRTHNVKKAVEAAKVFNFSNSIGQLVDA